MKITSCTPDFSLFPSIEDIITFERLSLVTEEVPVWRLAPIFRINVKGTVDEWWIGYNALTSSTFTVWGMSGGNLQAATKLIEARSAGTPFSQALIDVQHEYDKKLRNGYFTGDGPSETVVEAMLATIFNPSKAEFPYIIQPKLDGVRCLAFIAPEGIKFVTRGGKVFSHFIPVFGDGMKSFLSHLPEGSVVDGEIYLHGVPLQDISGAVRANVKISPLLIEHLNFNVFGYFIPGLPESIEERVSRLKSVPPYPRIIKVETGMVHDERELDITYKSCLSAGYEGMMLYRTLAGTHDISKCSYKKSRTANLQKLKPTFSSEGLVVGVKEAKGGQSGCAVIEVRVSSGDVVPMSSKVPMSTRRLWLKNPETIVGKVVTYEYRAKSQSGKPLYAVVSAVRVDE